MNRLVQAAAAAEEAPDAGDRIVQRARDRAAGESTVPGEAVDDQADGTDDEADEPAASEQAETGEADEPGGDDDELDDDEPDARVRRLKAEAAARRRELREAQAELETLRAQLAERDDELIGIRLDGAIAEHAGDLADRRDLLTYVERDELLEDGQPSAERITTAVATLLKERPHLRRRRFAGGADQGGRGDAPRPPTRTFADVLAGKPARR